MLRQWKSGSLAKSLVGAFRRWRDGTRTLWKATVSGAFQAAELATELYM